MLTLIYSNFDVQLVNDHIINPSQTMVSVMKIGNDREIMLTDYNNRFVCL